MRFHIPIWARRFMLAAVAAGLVSVKFNRPASSDWSLALLLLVNSTGSPPINVPPAEDTGWETYDVTGATYYYVDQSGGSDANDGLDPYGLALTDATYTHSTRKLTQTGMFAGASLLGGDENGDYLYLPGFGRVQVSSFDDDDECTLAGDGLGSDQTGVTSSDGPWKTLNHAHDTVTPGTNAQVLFKRGEAWQESVTQWVQYGADGSKRQRWGAYGDGARPKFTFPALSSVFITFNGGEDVDRDYLVFEQWHVYCSLADPDSGDFDATTAAESCRAFDFNYHMDQITIQGVWCEFCGVTFRDPGSNLMLNRCGLYRNWSTIAGGHSQGLFSTQINGLVVRECVFWHNGDHEDVSGADATIFKHNVYVQQDCQDVTFTRNFTGEPSSHGAQIRPGGAVTQNFCYHCPIGLLLGGGTSPVAGGVDGDLSDNVVMEPEDLDGSTPKGTGLDIENAKTVTCDSNILAQGAAGANRRAIQLVERSGFPNQSVSVTNNIVFDWESVCLRIGGDDSTGVQALTMSGNDFHVSGASTTIIQHADTDTNDAVTSTNDNFEWSGDDDAFNLGSGATTLAAWLAGIGGGSGSGSFTASYTDSSRDLASYMASVSYAGTVEEFVRDMCDRHETNWDATTDYGIVALINHVRGGFDLPALTAQA